MDGRALGDAIGNMIATLFILCVVFVPLGLWKALEIVVWVVRHLRITYQ